MAALGGTTVISPIRPPDSADNYPTHEAIFGKGGLRSVPNIAARDAIPAARREAGMVAIVGTAAPFTAFMWSGTEWINSFLSADEIQVLLGGKAETGHTHTESDITDLNKLTPAEVEQKIQIAINAASVLFPAGLPLDWPSNSPPAGTLARNGALVAVADFPLLHDVIGTAYNEVGDTDPAFFRLPDDRNKYTIGSGDLNVGDEVGQNEVDLTHGHETPESDEIEIKVPLLGSVLNVLNGTATTTDDALGLHDNRPESRAYLPIIIADPAEFVGGVASGVGAEIDDSVTETDRAWSGPKILSEIDQAVADVAENTAARHAKNSDTKLAEGTADESTAAEIRQHLDTPLVQRTHQNWLNLLDVVPKAEHEGIKDGTGSYDCYADIMTALSDPDIDLYIPAGRWQYNGEIVPLTSQCIFGDGMAHGSAYPTKSQSGSNPLSRPRYNRETVLEALAAGSRVNLKNGGSQLVRLTVDANRVGEFGVIVERYGMQKLEQVTVHRALDGGFALAGAQNSSFKHLKAINCKNSLLIANGAANNWLWDFQAECGNTLVETDLSDWRFIKVVSRPDLDTGSGVTASKQNYLFGSICDDWSHQMDYGVEVNDPAARLNMMQGNSITNYNKANYLVESGSTLYLEGNAANETDANSEGIITNRGLVVVGPSASVSSIGGNVRPFYPNMINNEGGVVQWGSFASVERPNLLFPESSFASKNAAYHNSAASTEGQLYSSGGSGSHSVEDEGGGFDLSWPATPSNFNVHLPPAHKATQYKQGVVYRLKFCVSGVTGGSGIYRVQAVYDEGSPTVMDLGIFKGGEFTVNFKPRYDQTAQDILDGVFGNYLSKIRFTAIAGGATALNVSSITLQDVGRAGA